MHITTDGTPDDNTQSRNRIKVHRWSEKRSAMTGGYDGSWNEYIRIWRRPQQMSSTKNENLRRRWRLQPAPPRERIFHAEPYPPNSRHPSEQRLQKTMEKNFSGRKLQNIPVKWWSTADHAPVIAVGWRASDSCYYSERRNISMSLRGVYSTHCHKRKTEKVFLLESRTAIQKSRKKLLLRRLHLRVKEYLFSMIGSFHSDFSTFFWRTKLRE